MSAIQKFDGSTTVQQWVQPEWSKERVDLMRKMIAPPRATQVEVEFFVGWCQRTGLDPFLKQAYFIERGQNVNGSWVVKCEPMASESGMAARVDAMPDFRGIQAAAVYDCDKFSIITDENGSQHVRHEWSLAERAKPGAKLLGAWAHCRRDGRVIQPTWLPLDSRIQKTKEGKPNRFWAVMPEGQITKCARAEQYRLAYPNIFGGVYIREEMPEDERESAPRASPPRTKTDEVKARVERILGKSEETVDATFTTPKPEPVAVTTPEKPAAELTTEREPGSDEEPGPKLGFNPDGHEGLKGRSIASLTGPQLAAAIATAEAKLKGSSKAPWAAKLSANLTELREESDARHAAVEAQS